ncbi:unnamed protein product [Cylicocyclus nassatus]|uniref:Uncharacterized protein n=1 Tax=Cylicocyclus nassatus TaxID=53992 RepID=A0AA36DL60_CYLNA|nr:unnamed protein product [Cylicocyclus nassatus]
MLPLVKLLMLMLLLQVTVEGKQIIGRCKDFYPPSLRDTVRACITDCKKLHYKEGYCDINDLCTCDR